MVVYLYFSTINTLSNTFSNTPIYLKMTARTKVIAGVKLLIADPRVGEL